MVKVKIFEGMVKFFIKGGWPNEKGICPGTYGFYHWSFPF